MSPDPNKKTPRSFQCRESLWQRFEQMARELECSVDYLINDAMKQYARQRGYTGANRPSDASPPPSASAMSTRSLGASPESTHGSGAHTAPGGSGAHSLTHGSGAHPDPVHARPPTHSAPAAPGKPIHAPPPLPVAPPPAPPAPGAKRVPQVPAALPFPTSSLSPPAPPPAMPGRVAPPPPFGGRASGAHPAQPVAPRTLMVRYQGQPFTVNKDRYVIGRGKQTSDLTIKDPNVSRQHALIEFINGQYIISDMGSTNGIEFQGQRVQRRAIADGDVVRICDHELSFSFR